MFGRTKTQMVARDDALPGRDTPMPVPPQHYVNGKPLTPPFPEGMQQVIFGMGCFWGAERMFWQREGVYTTAAGYSGGYTPNPTYEETCTAKTGHAEVVLVVYDPDVVTLDDLLKIFWEQHDPTQFMGQGNDIGTQYRSAVYYFDDEQRAIVEASRERYQEQLRSAGYGDITTELAPAGPFYYAEDYHQQYLAKNPNGYCNHGFCQVAYA